MKHQKMSLSVHGQKNIRDLNFNEAANNEYEPVQVAGMDDTSALIVDFSKASVQTKTLLDLQEATAITKPVEPFFLDATNGRLYSWASKTPSLIPEERKAPE